MMKKMMYVLFVFLGLFFIIGAHFFNKAYHKNVKSKPIMYCYENFRGLDKPISVLIIKDLDLKNNYIDYYKKLEFGEEPFLHDDIPLKTMPQFRPVYVMGYTKDSLMADVVSYYNRGVKFGGGYTRGWVYAKTLHKASPTRIKGNGTD